MNGCLSFVHVCERRKDSEQEGEDSCKTTATMNASDADRQIKQMVNFILQEAQEKANEIRIKVRFLRYKEWRKSRVLDLGSSRGATLAAFSC